MAAGVLAEFATKMKVLFRRLRGMQREAERELTAERVSARVNRAKDSFLNDRASGAKREHAFVLFEEMETALDNSEEADKIRIELQALRREFKIDEDLAEPISDFKTFCERLERVRYAGRLATQEPTLQESTVPAAQTTSSTIEAAASTAGDGEAEVCVDTESAGATSLEESSNTTTTQK